MTLISVISVVGRMSAVVIKLIEAMKAARVR